MKLDTCPHCGGSLYTANEKDNFYALEKKRLNNERAMAMLEAYKKDVTLEEIGACYQITRERVRQIITRANGGPVVGGKRILIALNKARSMKDRLDKKEEKMFKGYGCSVAFIESVTGGMTLNDKMSPVRKFNDQKHSAKTRGIEFNLTFKGWWDIWQKSGRWNERGRGQGYCMARIGDTGPYSIDNVEIKTIGENFSESYAKHPWTGRFPNVVKKTHCTNGHPRTPENVSAKGACRICQKISSKKHYETQKQLKADKVKK